ncbi:NapC/NirT family cytochrome c [Photobacterium leiognathi]|uniref:NapC/NirT family cytochrome c n=1 Tax=Photobacterium leiognathi TaxID=553611 RepID=UPI0029817C27|nr:NapC/NirT family cytochrome c [Photobacterium leiognathi]
MKFKKRTAVLLLAIGVGVGWLTLATTQTVLHKTSDTKFCISCHSMQKPLAEYQGTIHFQNEHGVRAECADCHIPTGKIDYLITKIRASKDIYHEFITGKIDSDEKFEQHRGEMAQTVWDQMKETDSSACRSCHEFTAMSILEQRPAAQKMHTQAMSDGSTCIDCHKGIAHLLPDTTDKAQAGADELSKAAASSSTSATELYSIATQPFFMTKDDEYNQGNLMPSTKVDVISREGDRVQATISGWQQDGVDSVIYAAKGKRIISALLSDDSKKVLKENGTETDPATGLVWHKVSLDVWADNKSFVDNEAPLWAYSSNLMNSNCTGCHGLTALDHYNANQWIGVIKAMETRTSLTKEQSRMLTQYVQKHASDMAGSEK